MPGDAPACTWETGSILVYGKLEASVSLYFDGLPADLRARLRFRRPVDLEQDLPWLMAASLVIVVREFAHMISRGTLVALQAAGVPVVWFTDDDLIALGREEAAFADCTERRVRRFLRHCEAVIVTSEPLTAVMAQWHRRVVLWPCVYNASLDGIARTARSDAMCVGAFGGGFRREAFRTQVLPALAQWSRAEPVQVFAAAGLAGEGDVGVVTVAFEPSFLRFVQVWRDLRLRALVHPYGQTRNIANKSMASVLVASYLGAVPVLGDEPAYAGLSEAEGVLIAAPHPASWRLALERLADADEAAGLYARLRSWCRRSFHSDQARPAFARIAELAAPGGAAAEAARWRCLHRGRQRSGIRGWTGRR